MPHGQGLGRSELRFHYKVKHGDVREFSCPEARSAQLRDRTGFHWRWVKNTKNRSQNGTLGKWKQGLQPAVPGGLISVHIPLLIILLKILGTFLSLCLGRLQMVGLSQASHTWLLTTHTQLMSGGKLRGASFRGSQPIPVCQRETACAIKTRVDES